MPALPIGMRGWTVLPSVAPGKRSVALAGAVDVAGDERGLEASDLVAVQDDDAGVLIASKH